MWISIRRYILHRVYFAKSVHLERTRNENFTVDRLDQKDHNCTPRSNIIREAWDSISVQVSVPNLQVVRIITVCKLIPGVERVEFCKMKPVTRFICSKRMWRAWVSLGQHVNNVRKYTYLGNSRVRLPDLFGLVGQLFCLVVIGSEALYSYIVAFYWLGWTGPLVSKFGLVVCSNSCVGLSGGLEFSNP